MDFEDRLNLVKKNVSEIVGKDKLETILENKKKAIAYCGYEPSGPIHLGHLVTLNKLADLEKAGIKTKILLADIHAMLNKKGEMSKIKLEVSRWKKSIKSMGLKSEIVLGSDFQFSEKYQREVMALAQHSTINRGLRSMQEIARDIENASISQLWYPLMQVADMKYLGIDIAVGGLEQRKVHMIGKDLLKITGHDFIALHTPLINSLKGDEGKMSSSLQDSLISITDSSKDIEKKIMGAYCPAGKIEENPVLQILNLIIFPKTKLFTIKREPKFGGDLNYSSYTDLENDFKIKKIHPLDLKKAVAYELGKIMSNISKKTK